MAVIRKMEKGDIKRVLEIYGQGIKSGRSTFNDKVPTVDMWDKGHHDFARFVACEDGEVIGWGAISPTSARECYKGVCEASVYIDEAHRGGGIGSALLNAVIEESEAHGVWTLFGSIFATNTASIKMSENNGFRVIGYRERIAKDIHGIWQNVVHMERRSKIVGI